MALVKLAFAAGLVKDDTALASEGTWIDADKIRFAKGRPEVIGGWQAMSADRFAGVARGTHAWADLSGRRYLAWGTGANLYAMVGGTIRDITPPHSEGVLTDAFTTVSASAIVTVAHAAHGFMDGMEVDYARLSAPVGGLTLGGPYNVTLLGPDSYTIMAASSASASATGGGNVDYTAALPAGPINGSGEAGGYGTGVYSSGGYSQPHSLETLPRVWFLDNWGETLIALPRGGGLYQWQPALAYPELIGSVGFVSGWTTGAGWSLASALATATAGTASDLSTPVAVTPGYVYRVTAAVTATAGTIVVRSDAGDLGAASAGMSVTGTYSRLFRAPAGMTQLVIHKDDLFIGTVGSVSVVLESAAYRIDEAPTVNAAMFVDPHQIAVLLGTTPYGGVYNPLAVRWCDRQNLTVWTPDVANLAGDDILAAGSRLIAGRATRQQNVLWSDSTLYAMQYTGDAATPFLFDRLATGCGLIGPLAHAEHDGTVFWSGTENFYSYSGAVPAPIPCRIERDVFDHIADKQGEKTVCGILPARSEVWFLYADSRDCGECSRYATFRWDEQHWTAGTTARSGWVKPGLFDHPILFGTDGAVYEHEIGTTANGGALRAFLDSAYIDIGDGDTLMVVRGIVGDFANLAGHVNFTIYARNWPNDAERVYGPFMHMVDTTKLDFRVTARQIRLRLSATAAPLAWRLGALRLDIVPSGAKR